MMLFLVFSICNYIDINYYKKIKNFENIIKLVFVKYNLMNLKIINL